MKLRFCVICGTNKDLQHHHIVPLSIGGQDHQHNIITLCTDHHDWIHDIQRTRTMKFTELVKAGQKKSGNSGGRPTIPQDKIDEIVYLWKHQGLSYRQIKKLTGAALATIQRYVKLEQKNELHNQV